MGILFSRSQIAPRRESYEYESQNYSKSRDTDYKLEILNEYLLLQTKWIEANNYTQKKKLLENFLKKTEQFVDNINSNANTYIYNSEYSNSSSNISNINVNSYQNTSDERDALLAEFSKRFSIIQNYYDNNTSENSNVTQREFINFYQKIVALCTESLNIHEVFNKEPAILSRSIILHLSHYFNQYVKYLGYCDEKKKMQKWQEFMETLGSDLNKYNDIDELKNFTKNYTKNDIAKLYKDTTSLDLFAAHKIISTIRASKQKEKQTGGSRKNKKLPTKQTKKTTKTSKKPTKKLIKKPTKKTTKKK